MHDNQLKEKIIETLNQKAQDHQHRHTVIDGVYARLEEKRHHRFNRWGVTGFALAAAITGIVIVPNDVMQKNVQPQQVNVNSQKLTPQLADDLEMLLVMGEDNKHGS
ncbi:hypothetical protein F4V57_09150 [Acinetobacter qingfengensis]|uniref:Uncharacterized protein n=1 Tax=Acinetobacter qingfengensis TaxID=1262585 RepID=A0A1E7RG76_9GAMM|nr:hypothetical protein [Acinetobacter qingfengensis]KAA8732721.1 hypothetical protein F4V57_09150 [Acinetobacter qingfengensis]OEY98165.1 hypothetical protein BJI46_01195 [Acinetobacter qingfengensis]